MNNEAKVRKKETAKPDEVLKIARAEAGGTKMPIWLVYYMGLVLFKLFI